MRKNQLQFAPACQTTRQFTHWPLCNGQVSTANPVAISRAIPTRSTLIEINTDEATSRILCHNLLSSARVVFFVRHRFCRLMYCQRQLLSPLSFFPIARRTIRAIGRLVVIPIIVLSATKTVAVSLTQVRERERGHGKKPQSTMI